MTELTAAELAQAQRDRDNSQRRWVESVKNKTCGAAASDVGTPGDALLIWRDANGEFRCQRIHREASVIREYVPAYLRRGSP